MLTPLGLPILSLLFMLTGIQMRTDGQVAILDHEVTLRMEPCCGAEELYTGLGLPTSGWNTFLREIHFLFNLLLIWVSVKL